MTNATTRTRDEAAPPPVEVGGGLIGRYMLLRELGAGGVGVVWAAHDPQLEREVAIKLLRDPEPRWDALIAEARAMARLRHPNVVTVHDAGRADDRVYLVMELIDGANAASWMRTPRTVDERVRVIVDAGHGLAAAHATGIVHRDFKPSNILVDRRGAARVTDFGLARPASVHVDAPTGAPDGTPLYLAPERYAGAAADPRSDQYSYCLSCVELLAGAPPFACPLDDEAALLAHKRAEAFDRRVLERVPRALRPILRRGVAADPARRWPDVATLTAAIARTRRRRWPVAVAVGVSAGAAAIAAAVGLHAPSTCEPTGAREIDRVLAPARIAAYQRRMAGDPARAALWRPIELAVRDARDAWNARYDAACAAHDAEAHRTVVCLSDRAAGFDQLLAEIETSPDALLAQSSPWITEARHLLRECDRPHAVKRGDRALRRDTDRAAWLRRAGRFHDARALATSAAERAQAAHDDVEQAAALHEAASAALEARDTAGAAQQDEAAHLAALRADDQAMAATTALLGGQIEVERNRYDDAARWFDKAEAYLTRLAPDGRDRRVADLVGARGQLAAARGNMSDAIALYRREVALREQLFGPDSPDAFPARVELGRVLAATGALDEAIATLERTLAVAETAYGPEHPNTSIALDSLAEPHLYRGDHARAIALWQRAAEILRRAYGPRGSRLATVDTNLAEVYEAAGDLDRAADAAREALAIRRTNPADPRTGYALRAIARIESARGRFDDARAHAEEARALAVRTLGPDHPQVASSLRTLGTVDLRQQRWADCRDRYTEAIAIQRRLEGGNLADLLEARANRAWCVAQLDQLPAARDELTEVVELAQARLPADTRALWFRYHHAEVLRRADDPRARQLLEELLPAVREPELRSLVEAALAPRR